MVPSCLLSPLYAQTAKNYLFVELFRLHLFDICYRSIVCTSVVPSVILVLHGVRCHSAGILMSCGPK